MSKPWIIVAVAIVVAVLILFFINQSNAQTANPPVGVIGGTGGTGIPGNPTGATGSMDCRTVCTGICKKYGGLFAGRQKCKNKCISDCTIGIDIIANNQNY